ncbi:MAG TPA: adenylosuccinate lyase, partial [Alphaproteobacteria bacterium]|nr:adenylosuccinate lyase [Alphaproteobacteria bacterium]
AVIPAMENVALWHERDISHSSVERFIAPDATVALDFSLNRLANVIENLLVYPERMMSNMERMGGLVFSQRTLLALTQSGISREDSYRIVQRNAMKVWESDGKITLREMLEQDADVKAKLDKAALDKIFDYSVYIKHAGTIIDRALTS